jgi:hypothetical protein
MLELSRNFIIENGGFLASLRKKSYQYLHQIIKKNRALKWQTLNLSKLDRTITHAHPHLDEYFADLLIRGALPEKKMNIDFMEIAIQSEKNDSTCKAYFPNGIVTGIGADVTGGGSALKLYDEHQIDGGRLEDSCSELVAKDLFKRTPWSINRILKEVNELDANGGAHTQHISNIIKAGHHVRFLHKKSENDFQNIQGWLTPIWKKTLMDISITAVIYCLENKINLSEYTSENKAWLESTLNHYQENTPFKSDSNFKKTIDRLRNTFFNQKVVFKQAKLPISKRSDQLLVLGKVCHALFQCWGEDIARIIMLHYWEILYQTQAVFNNVTDELNTLKVSGNTILHSVYGTIEKQVFLLPKIKAQHNERVSIPQNFHHNLWTIEVSQTPRLIMGNRPLINFLNKNNAGFGIIFFNDTFNCTKALFKGTSFPHNKWRKLVQILCKKEPECWYDTSETASFLVNGNRSHAYVPLSQMELKDLTEIIRIL